MTDYSSLVTYEWSFGDDKNVANILKDLVLSGAKTATTGLWREEKVLPKVGGYAAILDTEGKRFCVIEYVNVEAKPFLEVGYEFVKKEGESDPDLTSWRNKHREIFHRWSNTFDDQSLVVCEEFVLVQALK